MVGAVRRGNLQAAGRRSVATRKGLARRAHQARTDLWSRLAGASLHTRQKLSKQEFMAHVTWDSLKACLPAQHMQRFQDQDGDGDVSNAV